jgi:hypothetical protein
MQKLLHSYFASKQSNLNTNTSDSIEKSNHGDSVPESEDNIIKKLLLYNGGRFDLIWFDFWCLTPLLAIFQLYQS